MNKEDRINLRLAALRDEAETGLHLGCGDTRIAGMINCDLFAPGADRKISSTDLAEFATGSVQLIESHHMIEHLSPDDMDRALAEWARVLVPGGHLVVSCPNLTRVCARFLWWRFIQATGLMHDRATRRLDYTRKMLFGSQEHEGMLHKSGYNSRLLGELLPRFGFEVEEMLSPWPRKRLTPSILVVARRLAGVTAGELPSE